MQIIGRCGGNVIAHCRCGRRVQVKRAQADAMKDCGCRARRRYHGKAARIVRLSSILPMVSDAYRKVKLAPNFDAGVDATFRMFRLLAKHDLDFRDDVFKEIKAFDNGE